MKVYGLRRPDKEGMCILIFTGGQVGIEFGRKAGLTKFRTDYIDPYMMDLDPGIESNAIGRFGFWVKKDYTIRIIPVRWYCFKLSKYLVKQVIITGNYGQYLR